MGMLQINAWGSFPEKRRTFRAQEHGHAHAVAEAMQYLSEELLPWAIARDHELQSEGSTPDKGFDKSG